MGFPLLHSDLQFIGQRGNVYDAPIWKKKKNGCLTQLLLKYKSNRYSQGCENLVMQNLWTLLKNKRWGGGEQLYPPILFCLNGKMRAAYYYCWYSKPKYNCLNMRFRALSSRKNQKKKSDYKHVLGSSNV